MIRLHLTGLVLITLAGINGFEASAIANQVCIEALKRYDSESGPSTTEERHDLIKVCHGSARVQNPMLEEMLRYCGKMLGGKASPKEIEQCQIDAYRFISWGSYPGGPYHR
jgi:hypothetical protein